LTTKRIQALSKWQTFLWDFTDKMAAKIKWHRYGGKLRHCHLMYFTWMKIFNWLQASSVGLACCEQTFRQSVHGRALLRSIEPRTTYDTVTNAAYTRRPDRYHDIVRDPYNYVRISAAPTTDWLHGFPWLFSDWWILGIVAGKKVNYQARRNVLVSGGGYKFVRTLYNLVVKVVCLKFWHKPHLWLEGTGVTSPELGGTMYPLSP